MAGGPQFRRDYHRMGMLDPVYSYTKSSKWYSRCAQVEDAKRGTFPHRGYLHPGPVEIVEAIDTVPRQTDTKPTLVRQMRMIPPLETLLRTSDTVNDI